MIWDAKKYDLKHSFVTEYGNDVLNLLDPKPGERILDAGCGTGHLTAKIAESGAEAVGLDCSEAMLEVARSAYPEIEFWAADASNFTSERPFDAVFSNAALHWMLDYENVARCLSAALRPGGRFVVEMGGKGNLDNVMSALAIAISSLGYDVSRPPKFYPSPEEYSKLLDRHGIAVEQSWHFPRPTKLQGSDGLRHWYEQFGRPMLDQLPEEIALRAIEVSEESLRPTHFDGKDWTADYVRLRVVAKKS